jgi:hypothetical protein
MISASSMVILVHDIKESGGFAYWGLSFAGQSGV